MRRSTAPTARGQRGVLLVIAGSGLALAAFALCGSAPARVVEIDAGHAAVRHADATVPLLFSADAPDQRAPTRSAPAGHLEHTPQPNLVASTAQLLVRVDAEPERARRVSVVMVENSHATVAVIAAQRTGEDGVASFAPCSAKATNPSLDLDIPTCGAYARPIDAATRAAGLVLPDLGMLRLRVVEGDGSPITGSVTAEVRVLDAIPPATRAHTMLFADGQGCVLVEAAALDLEVRVTAADGRVAQPVRARGPAVAGGVSTCSVELVAPRSLRARLLDPRGQALSQAKVAVHVDGSGARLASDLVTDSRGVVAFRAPISPGRGRAVRLVFLAHDTTDRHWQGQAFVDLQPDAEVMLGDVILCEPPTIVAGVCVDRDGLPRRDVVLRVQAQQTMATDKSGRPAVAWVDLPWASVASRADGSFEAAGNVPPGQRLRLIALGQDVAPRAFLAGATDVRIALPRRNGWPGARR